MHELHARALAALVQFCGRCARAPLASVCPTGWCSESTERIFTVDSTLHGLCNAVPAAHLDRLARRSARADAGQAEEARGRAAAVPHRYGRADGRSLRRGARHRRADRRAALCIRHAARPHRVGRRPSGVSAQGADRPPRQAAHDQAQERPRAVPDAQRERIRHVRRRPFEHVDQRRARHGDRRRAQRRSRAAWSRSSATARSAPAWRSRR